MEFAEELSKEISKELNETIIIYQVEGCWIKCHDDTNMYCMSLSNQVPHRYFPTNINKNESLLLINGEKNYKISLFCYSKCDITTIIQMYNETREYKNSLNKEFNLDCPITTFYNDNNVIDEVIIHISEYDLGEYIQPIYAKTYLECYEQINKIITLKNELLSQYGTIEESHSYESQFVLNINNNEIITLQCTLYDEYEDEYEEDIRIRITIDTNKLLIYEVYNQFINNINNFIKKFDNDDCFRDIYCDIGSIYIDMSYKHNNSNVYVKISSKGNPHITLTIKCENNNIDFSVITEIYNEVINYIAACHCNITEINVIYNSNNLVNISATYNMNNIYADNYIEFTEKLEVILFEQRKLYEEDRLKKELEKQKLEQERIIKEQKKIEEDIQKIVLELSTQLKEDIIIKEFTNTSFIILGEGGDTKYKIKINVKYCNIIHVDISKIYNEVRTFIINDRLHNIYQLHLYIETDYNNCCPNKITLKWDDNEIYGQNYLECNQKIIDYIKLNKIILDHKLGLKIKEEQEKFATKLKLKYGDKTVLSKSNDYLRSSNNYDYKTSIINVAISNVDIEHIDLLDIIYNYSGYRIVNGFIKQTNCANYAKYINGSIDKPIFNISVLNCPNLKIINNIIDFENNCNLKIDKCPKLEFIQNYNNFSEIYINNHKVKLITE
jgi:hypothetical protein